MGVHAPDACKLRRAGVCEGAREDGYSSCAPCREARRKAEAAERAERRKERRCLLVSCDARAAKGRRYCARHLAYYAERDRVARASR